MSRAPYRDADPPPFPPPARTREEILAAWHAFQQRRQWFVGFIAAAISTVAGVAAILDGVVPTIVRLAIAVGVGVAISSIGIFLSATSPCGHCWRPFNPSLMDVSPVRLCRHCGSPPCMTPSDPHEVVKNFVPSQPFTPMTFRLPAPKHKPQVDLPTIRPRRIPWYRL